MMRYAFVLLALFAIACSGSGREKLNNGSPDSLALDLAVGEDTTTGDEDALPDAGPSDTSLPDVQPTDTTPEDAGLPDGCCLTADDCPGAMVCVGMEDGGAGQCVEPPPEYECWSDADCELPDTCHNVSVCGCEELCVPMLGVCMHPIEPPFCCQNDDECGFGLVCIGSELGAGAGGTCEMPPENGTCYYNEHCPEGHYCVGQDVCSCDMNCISEPGVCIAYNVNCCKSDGDCAPGQLCSPTGDGSDLGVCKDQPPAGYCWADGHCGPGESCSGASICPCDADCAVVDMPGACLSSSGDICCLTDEDCPQFLDGEAMFCFIQDGNPFIEGTCQPVAPPGKCWSDDDCYMIQTCEGVGFCPCGMDCQAPGTTMGDCTPLPQGCCYDDGDCAQGLVCRGNQFGDNMPGSCVADPNGPQCLGDAQCCWDNADCNGGTCNGASVCGCIALCPVCGDCMPDQMGYCG